MHAHHAERASASPSAHTTLLVGNPNVGKSVLFGYLTGRYATVSNYPGTTVEITRGQRRQRDGVVLDLPGTNSLLPNSEDEQVTRDVLLAHLGDRGADVVQICDAKNLRRGVAIALQLAELEAPMVFVANMLDEAHSRGIELDLGALEAALGVPVLGTVAALPTCGACGSRVRARPGGRSTAAAIGARSLGCCWRSGAPH